MEPRCDLAISGIGDTPDGGDRQHVNSQMHWITASSASQMIPLETGCTSRDIQIRLDSSSLPMNVETWRGGMPQCPTMFGRMV